MNQRQPKFTGTWRLLGMTKPLNSAAVTDVAFQSTHRKGCQSELLAAIESSLLYMKMINFVPETQHSRTHIATKAKAKTTEIFIDFSVWLSWILKGKQEDLIWVAVVDKYQWRKYIINEKRLTKKNKKNMLRFDLAQRLVVVVFIRHLHFLTFIIVLWCGISLVNKILIHWIFKTNVFFDLFLRILTLNTMIYLKGQEL